MRCNKIGYVCARLNVPQTRFEITGLSTVDRRRFTLRTITQQIEKKRKSYRYDTSVLYRPSPIRDSLAIVKYVLEDHWRDPTSSDEERIVDQSTREPPCCGSLVKREHHVRWWLSAINSINTQYAIDSPHFPDIT